MTATIRRKKPMAKTGPATKRRYDPFKVRRRLRYLGVFPGEVHKFAYYSMTREGREIEHEFQADLLTGRVECSCENFGFDLTGFNPDLHDTDHQCKHIKRALCWLRRHHFLEVSLAVLRPCRRCGVAEAEYEMCDGRGEPMPGHHICADCVDADMDDLSDAAPARPAAPLHPGIKPPVPAFPGVDDDLSGAPTFTRRGTLTVTPERAVFTDFASAPAYQPERPSIARPEYVATLGSGPAADYLELFDD